MEGCKGLLAAIPARDAGQQVAVLLRHWRLGDLLIVDPPHVRHVHHAHPAHWARVVAIADHVIETGFVDQMIARWDLGGNP